MKGNHWMEIRNDRKKGLSYTEIAKKHHMDPRTAKKYAESDSKPSYQLTSPKTSKLDPYKPQIDLWLEEAPYSAVSMKNLWSRDVTANIQLYVNTYLQKNWI